MSDLILPAYSPVQRNADEAGCGCPQMVMTPWTVQNIVYELIKDHMLRNDPAALGYNFQQRYSMDDTKSDVLLTLRYDWKAATANKRPAIIVGRSAATYAGLTMGQDTSRNSPESEKGKLLMVTMSCPVYIIASPIGFAENFADYIHAPLLEFEEPIRNDFNFRKFRASAIQEPQIYKEAKDHFIIVINVETVFDKGFIIKRDDLKLKTVSLTIFDSCSPNVPLKLQ